MENDLISNNQLNFEGIKHIDKNGVEFWYARELMPLLEYSKWGNFKNVISKAIEACKGSNISELEHFADVGRVLKVGNNADMPIDDIKLSRYACYLITQNGDSRKKAIALAQTYFAIQTRKQELTEDEYKQLSEDEKRLYNRKLVSDRNKYLFDTAKASGVENYAKFNNAGYMGLYNGETAEDIKIRKGISEKDHILDHMGSAELGANIFRITQTDEMMKTNKVNSENEACTTHNKVGKAVRKAIEELGGTMPEKLPTPKKSIKQIQKEAQVLRKLSAKRQKKLK